MKRTRPVDQEKLKETLSRLDTLLLAELLRVTRSALCVPAAEKRSASELGISVERVRALSNIAFQLSMEPDELPEISTVVQLDALSEAGENK